jgi:ABC-type transport system substrate-binding protein
MMPPAGWNVYHLCNSALDAAERTALVDYDQKTRAAAYRRIQELVVDTVPMIPLAMLRQSYVVSVDFHGFRPAHVATAFWNTWHWSI